MGNTTRYLVASAAITMIACTKRVPEPVAVSARPAASAAATPAAAGSATVVHGTRRLAYPDVPVYVDGAQVSVLKYAEFPQTMKPVVKPGDDFQDQRYYLVSEYLKAIGVDVASVKAVHFMGKGGRIMSLEGSEIRARKSDLFFDFAYKDSGLPRPQWSFEGLKRTTWNDFVYSVHVFVNRAVPKLDATRFCYFDAAENACSEAAPYAEGKVAKGTRIYLDSKMVGFVKRRLVSDAAIVGKKDDGATKYSLTAVLKDFGVDLTNAKAVELIAGDSVVARATRDQWQALKGELFFTLPEHGHGKVSTFVPADIQAKVEGAADREMTITAVEVYRKSPPAERQLTAPDDVPDVTVNGDDLKQAKLGSGEGRATDL